MDFKGKHIILDLKNVEFDLYDNSKVRSALISSVIKTKATIKGIYDNEFVPYGYSCVILISESHASVHTFPEEDGVFIDCFTCGDLRVEEFEKEIIRLFRPRHIKRSLLNRGI